MLLEAFHQVSAQEDRWVKRRCWLKNSKMVVSAWPSLISEWNDLSNPGSPFCLEDSYQFSAQKKIWV